ncbi:MAG TPA: PPC domain-containing DNA-binding protein [Candidatus Baltobacteraceae bacterium]|nr:PPC domain-containing DNA-binding protein [Candidatus Baltobacteraceae bacterium]
MKHKWLAEHAGVRKIAMVFDVDDDVLAELQQFCETERIFAATLCAIGGFRTATLAFYNMETKTYEPIEVDEQVEVLSLLGNVTEYRGKPKIHAHCTVGHRDGRTTGGHLLAAIVRPTLELTIDELPSDLHRTDRPEIGIPLIELP